MPGWAWLALGPAALIALFWASRGALLGTPVADDYAFLYRLAFQRPLDFFDSMGATYYWRPLSRQVYFTLTGGWLIQAPWAAAALHAGILLALFLVLYATARRGLAPAAAAAIALFPLLAEPARALLTWPSGIQHLLAALLAALAVHEALAGRIVTSGVASLAGVLSHESAALAIPALPIVAWLRTRRTGEALRWAGVAGAVAAVWAAGYAVALAHGVQLPPGGARPLSRWDFPSAFALALAAALDLEDLPRLARDALIVGYAALMAFALLALVRRRGRDVTRPRYAVPLLAGMCFVLGMIPLAALLPDWNSWRAWVPSLGLGIALTAFLGLASPWLAGGFVALRLVALLLAAPAPVIVSGDPAETTSDMSFRRLARLQRTVMSTHQALRAHAPQLPRAAAVRFASIPNMAGVGFVDSLAVRVWYRDSTIQWRPFGGRAGLTQHVDALIQFADEAAWPASVVDPTVVSRYQRGSLAMLAGDAAAAESLLLLAWGEQGTARGAFSSSLALNLATIALNRGQVDRADSLVRTSFELGSETADHWWMVAAIAMRRRDPAAAMQAVSRCLELSPDHAQGRRLAAALGMRR